jgi:hypothetical protein
VRGQIYITTEPLASLPMLLFLFVIAHLPRMVYRREFGAAPARARARCVCLTARTASLVSRKRDDGMDGAPFVIGVGSLFRQVRGAGAGATVV